MPIDLHRSEVRRMAADGAQLLEVLSPDEYGLEHLPKAINIPLRKLDRDSTAQLQKDRPIITYCHDYQ